jgi:Ca-activated chloride channel family protein
MRWANPEYLWLLLLVPAIIAYTFWFRADDLPELRFPSIKRIPAAAPGRRWDYGVITLGVLRASAVLLMVLALARPQKGLRSEEITAKATDIMFCLDASRSMLTLDFKPSDRFDMAKKVVSEFVKGREQDRMGLVLFAEHAITQCPLTLDRSALLSVLENIHVGAIPPDQTAIGVGLATTVNRLKKSSAKSKVVILVTDGVNNAGSVDPVTAAKTAAAFGIKIYTIGAGSPEGGMIPIPDPIMGQRLVQANTDLDEDTLLKVASETGGKYFRAKSSEMLKAIFNEIDAMEKTDIRVKEYVDYKELYLWLLLPAAFLLLIEMALNKTIFRTVP